MSSDTSESESDTKIISNKTYKLLKCREKEAEIKFWVPECLTPENTDIRKTVFKPEENANINKAPVFKPEKTILTLDEKVAKLYQQLSKGTEYEIERVERQVLTLNISDLPPSKKPVIHSSILKLMRHYKKRNTNDHGAESMIKSLRMDVMQEEAMNRRRDQLSMLYYLQQEMNHITKGREKITVENHVDFAILPHGFSYTNTNVPGVSVVFPKNPPMGCDCLGQRMCLLNNCCPEKFNSQPTYNEWKEIMVPPSFPIYECNRSCKCSKTCANRVVQHGTKLKFVIFRTPNCGWGVRADEPIMKGNFVIEYVGQIIRRDDALRIANDKQIRHHLFDLHFNDHIGSDLYTINSKEHGNISRFINHSCEPNMHLYSVWINWSEPNIYHLVFFSARDIFRGEELTFDYSVLSKHGDRLPELCKCGSELCKDIFTFVQRS